MSPAKPITEMSAAERAERLAELVQLATGSKLNQREAPGNSPQRAQTAHERFTLRGGAGNQNGHTEASPS